MNKEFKTETYSFKIEHATKYGLDEAVILKNLAFWVEKNEANNKNFYEGKYWTYNSLEAFKTLFPFWSEKQLRRILLSLEKQGVIETGNFNKTAYDRTKWYTLKSEEKDISILPNSKMDCLESGKGLFEKGEPIPYIKQDIKQDIKPPQKKNNFCDDVITLWNEKSHHLFKAKTDDKTIYQAINKKRKTENDDDILKAINRYFEVINSDKYWYTNKFTLKRFIYSGYENFKNEEFVNVSYLKDSKTIDTDMPLYDFYLKHNILIKEVTAVNGKTEKYVNTERNRTAPPQWSPYKPPESREQYIKLIEIANGIKLTDEKKKMI